MKQYRVLPFPRYLDGSSLDGICKKEEDFINEMAKKGWNLIAIDRTHLTIGVFVKEAK